MTKLTSRTAFERDIQLFPFNITLDFTESYLGKNYLLCFQGLMGDDVNFATPYLTSRSFPHIKAFIKKGIAKRVGGISANRKLGISLGFRNKWEASNDFLITEKKFVKLTKDLKEVGFKLSKIKNSIGTIHFILSGTANTENALNDILNQF